MMANGSNILKIIRASCSMLLMYSTTKKIVTNKHIQQVSRHNWNKPSQPHA
jgi:hypothetical protein